MMVFLALIGGFAAGHAYKGWSDARAFAAWERSWPSINDDEEPVDEIYETLYEPRERQA